LQALEQIKHLKYRLDALHNQLAVLLVRLRRAKQVASLSMTFTKA
jgi:hypothetical protein